MPAPSSVADPGVQRRQRDQASDALLGGIGDRAGAAVAGVGRSLLSGLETELSPPPSKAKTTSRAGQLERQANALYPLIRARLRADLVRDLERRGRITREWW